MESTIHRPTILHNGANGVTRVYVDERGMTLQQFSTGPAGFKEIQLTPDQIVLLREVLTPTGQSDCPDAYGDALEIQYRQ